MYKTRLSITPTNFETESPSLKLEKPGSLPEKRVDADDVKKKMVEAVTSCINSCQQPEFANRWGNDGDVDTFVIEPVLGARLIVNAANGMLENAGLCLHRTFGYPYIPGSAVKGVARHAAWSDWKETAPENQSLKDSKALSIAAVFGYPTNDEELDACLKKLRGDKAVAGNVCFYPAEPAAGKIECEVDILNVHHCEYYAGKRKVATDDENPKLCYFPVVKAGQKFRFAIRRMGQLTVEDLRLAQKWLKEGLSLFGIGAKTSAGYGWFDIPEDCSDIVRDEKFLSELTAKFVVDGKDRKSVV